MKKKTQTSFFYCKSEKKQNQAPKKNKNVIWIVGELHSFWCGDFAYTFVIIVFFKKIKIEEEKKYRRKNAILLVLPFEEISLQPELSSARHFRIQGG